LHHVIINNRVYPVFSEKLLKSISTKAKGITFQFSTMKLLHSPNAFVADNLHAE